MKKPEYETTDCQCIFLSQCTLIHENQMKMPELVARIQDDYCTQSSYYQCARFRVYQSLGVDMVPPLMLPDQIGWARQIIEECDCGF